MNSTGIATAGGFGKALAEWISLGNNLLGLFYNLDINVIFLSRRTTR